MGISSDNVRGFLLAVSSSVFIGSSTIIKKKGLIKSGAAGTRAGLVWSSFVFFFLLVIWESYEQKPWTKVWKDEHEIRNHWTLQNMFRIFDFEESFSVCISCYLVLLLLLLCLLQCIQHLEAFRTCVNLGGGLGW